MVEPSPATIRLAKRFLAPWNALARPVFVGLDRIPAEGPVLFVGNHTLGGFLDAPLMVLGVHEHTGRTLHALGDRAHFQVPGWRRIMAEAGVVEGTRANCARLMEEGKAILVFPGGAREVAKRKGERYKLVWKQRLGFARMALAHRCPIVPFAAVGVEDALDIVLDAEDLLASPLGPLIRRLGLREDLLVPVVKGLGITPLPRPERLYFVFGAPVDPTTYGTEGSDDRAARALREEVAARVEAGIRELVTLRAEDPDREVRARLARVVKARLGGE